MSAWIPSCDTHREVMSREPCLHCGKQISKEDSVSLRTVSILNKLQPDEYVATIVRLEEMPTELAQEFVDHKMGLNCAKTEPPCPICAAPLKTWHATGCWHCGWRREANKGLPDYFFWSPDRPCSARSDRCQTAAIR